MKTYLSEIKIILTRKPILKLLNSCSLQCSIVTRDLFDKDGLCLSVNEPNMTIFTNAIINNVMKNFNHRIRLFFIRYNFLFRMYDKRSSAKNKSKICM